MAEESGFAQEEKENEGRVYGARACRAGAVSGEIFWSRAGCQPEAVGIRHSEGEGALRARHWGLTRMPMSNDAKLGLVVGMALVLLIAILFFRREPAPTGADAPAAAALFTSGAAGEPR